MGDSKNPLTVSRSDSEGSVAARSVVGRSERRSIFTEARLKPMYQKRTIPVPYTGRYRYSYKAHGENAEFHAKRGTEVWSKRGSIAHVNGWDITNPDYKTVTHRIERRLAKRELYAALREVA